MRMGSAEYATRLAVALLVAVAAAPAAHAAGAALRKPLAWQIALEGVGYSPGILDGIVGPKTRLATREFQRVRKLPVTGRLDAKTAELLAVRPEKAVTAYTVQKSDLAEVGPLPRGWVARSEAGRLPYPSLDEMLAEKFHCSRRLLARLNPGKTLARLDAGDTLRVPALAGEPAPVPAARLDINLTEKVLRVYDGQKRLTALFHCSIAADRARRPSGKASVAVIAMDPVYTFDPKKWPEVRGVDRKLILPAGPRNPVGLCWIGLSLPGYGIHGSPQPELIGKTGSHGCFRLTNWDVLRLVKRVKAGTPVTFSTGRTFEE